MEIPDATPYPWAPSERLVSLQPHKLITSTSGASASASASNSSKKSANSSTGFFYLQHELLLNKSPSQISQTAKNLLSQLLDEHNVNIMSSTCSQEHTHNEPSSSAPSSVAAVKNHKRRVVTTVVTDTDMSDETVLEMAAAGELSFLGSLLSMIEQGGDGTDHTIRTNMDPPVDSVTSTTTTTTTSTRTLIRTCSLAVPPAHVPAAMDCKEMVMAALHFLSTVPVDVTVPTSTPTPTPTLTQSLPNADADMEDTDTFIHTATATATASIIQNTRTPTPLIRAHQMTPDLEKRSYQKVGDWKLADILESQVAELEQVFLSGSKEYAWLGREHFCPRLPVTTVAEDKDYAMLLLKGSPPVHAIKPKKAAPVQRKKKATVDLSMSTATTTDLESGDIHNKSMHMNDEHDMHDEEGTADADADADIDANDVAVPMDMEDTEGDADDPHLDPGF
jgi:hypothetical protein